MKLFKKFLIVVLIVAIMCAAIWMVTYGAIYETIGDFPGLIDRVLSHTMFMTFSYTIIIGICYLIIGFIKLLLKKTAKDYFTFSGLLMLMAIIITGILSDIEPMNQPKNNEQIVEDNKVLQKNIKALENENKALDNQVKKLEEEITKQNNYKTGESTSTRVTSHEKVNDSVPPSSSESKENSANYDKNGNYKPVDQMKPEEIKKELEGMLEESFKK
ncbi:hypothetical protein COE20_14050 [Bacillus cereus]|uniref:hypothetical protein n=1 Tax=Bacillus cereus TaxID=1396 RepID=UPI000BEC5241|nr:hypothetical protein [Bacillus cereus]PEC56474.1 hypothetical protein CON05_04605 [Bacillus cereus]PFE49684.1 hypothetical protein CN317_04765 [Bacillus cereus]PFN12128.1 hypothetical protein COJ72_28265 [Bacillus cereus]PFS82179.1 hypothetical protein COK56_08690 [Bacillus cereus]PGY27902.1 hypothetical protein COE20_14050 [Bacillus cereus]